MRVDMRAFVIYAFHLCIIFVQQEEGANCDGEGQEREVIRAPVHTCFH